MDRILLAWSLATILATSGSLVAAAPSADRLAGLTELAQLCPVITEVGVFGDVTTVAAGGTSIYYRIGSGPWAKVPMTFKGVHSLVRLPNGRWLIGDTDNHRVIQIDDLAQPGEIVARSELAGHALKRPHDELVDPITGDVYVVDGERRLFRFKDLQGPIEAWTFTPQEMGYVRALSWFDGRLHVINSSRAEVIRIDSFSERRFTTFRSPRPKQLRGAASTQVRPGDSREDFDAGALATTGLVLNDVDKHGDWYYGTNFFLPRFAPGADTSAARLIRWRTWEDFERGRWEDLSTLIPMRDPPAVPYFITVHDNLLYIPTSTMPDERCEYGAILTLDPKTVPSK